MLLTWFLIALILDLKYSLTLALEELGFPTLHTQHLYEHRGIIDMWTNQIFLPSIRADKATLGEPDLGLIASYGYTATADLPMALYFDQVLQKYPDCKFILTTRENSQVWFRSWDTLTKSISTPTALGGFFFSNVQQYSYYLRWLFAIVNKDDSYLTAPIPLPDQDEATAIASYEEHNRRVRATIPPKQLLEYDVRQGWTPLCEFLEITNCPTETPFPKTNSARSVQVQAASALLFPMMISLFCVFFMFAKVFERLTGMTVMQWADYKSRELLVTLRRTMIGHEKIEDWAPVATDDSSSSSSNSDSPRSLSKRIQKEL
jgi:Sulfotransferase domain